MKNKKRGPFLVTSSKAIYKNPWIDVREDKVVWPNGKDGIFGVVTVGHGVTVLVMDENKNVYLTREYHYAEEEVTLEAVSGGMDKGETPLAAAKRELKEETGFTAKKWTYLGYTRPLTTFMEHINHLYLAQDLIEGRADPDEIVTIKKIPIQKAVDLVANNTIVHAASVIVILKVAEMMKSREVRSMKQE